MNESGGDVLSVNADFLMNLICNFNDRVESRLRPRLGTSVDGQMVQLSKPRRRSQTISIVLLLFSFSSLDDIQVYMLCRQLTMDCRGS